MSNAEPRSAERSRRRYSFGEFTLDLEGGALTRGGEEITLRPKSFEVLTYLVEHHGQLVTKSAIVEAVWPDTAVGGQFAGPMSVRHTARPGRRFAAIDSNGGSPRLHLHAFRYHTGCGVSA